MLIDKTLIDELFAEAQNAPRKRAYFDLRNGAEDDSQRMLVAVLPSEAKEVIHRHQDSSESLVVICGNMTEIYYDEAGNELERITLDPTIGHFGLQVPKGVFHTLIAHTPSVFIESKAGKYAPCKPEDLLKIE